MIPLNSFPTSVNPGIVIRKTGNKDLNLDKIKEAHRDDYYLFLIFEEGSGLFEIDFQRYALTSSSVMIIEPYQVHRGIEMNYNDFSVLMISTENLNPDYPKLIHELDSLVPLTLDKNTFDILKETVGLCLKLSARKNEKLYTSLLKESSNTLAAFIISQYYQQLKKRETLSRFEIVAHEFKRVLEQHFLVLKRPLDYAEKMKISTVYLNECVKKATGKPISYHIQQRIILEAKRLLFHSNMSVKEIAVTLGYHDYPYFSRLFSKMTGMSALTFRSKNLE